MVLDNVLNKSFDKDVALLTGLKVYNIRDSQLEYNYYRQDEILTEKLMDSVIKSERELEKKWNLEENSFYIENADNDESVYLNLCYNIGQKYNDSAGMEILENAKILDENKSGILSIFNKEIEKIGQRNNFSNIQINEMKCDAKKLVSNNFDNVIKNILNADSGNKMIALCDKWKSAYQSFDFNAMEKYYKKLKNMYSGDSLYRGEQIMKQVE